MELEIIRFIQKMASPLADNIFKIITMLGEEFLIIPVIAFVYWCVDKSKGIYLMQSVVSTLTLGNISKDIIKRPRPIGKEGIRSLYTGTATGYSMPSIHSINISSLLTSLNILKSNLSFIIMSIITVLAVGLSRVYLGVHYPSDVLWGILIGTILPFVLAGIFEYFRNEIIISGAITLIMTGGFLFSPTADFYKSYGLCVGLFLGLILEKYFVGFKMPKTRRLKIFRFILGLILSFGINWLLGKYLPIINNYMYIVKYGIIALFTVGLYPWIFKKINA